VPAYSAAFGRRFPVPFRQAFHWSDRRELFIVALKTQAELLDRRSRLLSAILPSVLEPLALILVGTIFLYLVSALFMPLIKLLNDLS